MTTYVWVVSQRKAEWSEIRGVYLDEDEAEAAVVEHYGKYWPLGVFIDQYELAAWYG